MRSTAFIAGGSLGREAGDIDEGRLRTFDVRLYGQESRECIDIIAKSPASDIADLLLRTFLRNAAGPLDKILRVLHAEGPPGTLICAFVIDVCWTGSTRFFRSLTLSRKSLCRSRAFRSGHSPITAEQLPEGSYWLFSFFSSKLPCLHASVAAVDCAVGIKMAAERHLSHTLCTGTMGLGVRASS